MDINLHIHSVGVDELKTIEKMLTKLLKLGETMNQAIQDFLTKQNAYNKAISDAVDAANVSLQGLTGDIKSLNDKITEIQNSAGAISAEDQAALDAAATAGQAAVDKLTAVTNAMKALDEATPPVAGTDVTEVVKP